MPTPLVGRCYSSLLLFFLIWSTRRLTLAQEKPFTSITKFKENVTFRTNICDRQRLLYQDLIELPDVLQGLNLTVALTNYKTPNDNALFTLDSEGRIPKDKPGLFAIIMDELARRASFTWRNSFVAIEPLGLNENRTWSDLLEWEVNTFDISMEYWARTIDRMARGISFPEGWYDSSAILVETVNPNETSEYVNLWSFLTPFEWQVWVMIFVAILCTGFMYWVLERLNSDADERDMENKPFATIFLSALAFTGHFEFRPQTHASRILTFSWTFWALIVASAYTANLASFLVAGRTTGIRIHTVQDAIRLKAPVCIQAYGSLDDYLTTNYPSIRLVRKQSNQDVFQGLINGECNVAGTNIPAFDIYSRTASINPDCSLSSEKRTIRIVPSGLATAVDTGTLCTSLISHALDLHMVQMHADRFIDRAWEDHLQRIGDQNCLSVDELGGNGPESETFSLSLQEMGGIFIVHGLLTAVAITIALFQFFYMKKETPRDFRDRLFSSRELTKDSGQRSLSVAEQSHVIDGMTGTTERLPPQAPVIEKWDSQCGLEPQEATATSY